MPVEIVLEICDNKNHIFNYTLIAIAIKNNFEVDNTDNCTNVTTLTSKCFCT